MTDDYELHQRLRAAAQAVTDGELGFACKMVHHVGAAKLAKTPDDDLWCIHSANRQGPGDFYTPIRPLHTLRLRVDQLLLHTGWAVLPDRESFRLLPDADVGFAMRTLLSPDGYGSVLNGGMGTFLVRDKVPIQIAPSETLVARIHAAAGADRECLTMRLRVPPSTRSSGGVRVPGRPVNARRLRPPKPTRATWCDACDRMGLRKPDDTLDSQCRYCGSDRVRTRLFRTRKAALDFCRARADEAGVAASKFTGFIQNPAQAGGQAEGSGAASAGPGRRAGRRARRSSG